jgi:TolB-like protein/class 3 adenylate cyclase
MGMLQEYTIMFTDIVAYTRLIRQDEQILGEILQHHQKVHRDSVQAHSGKLIHCRADGSLSLFASASGAIRAAIDIQEGCRDPHQIPVRIGIHRGKVRHVGEEIVGDSLNTAFRIRTIATEGSILISEDVYEEVKGQVDLIFKRLGLFNLKHTPDPVLLYVTGSPDSSLPGREAFRDDSSPPENSIAVLPFRDLSAGGDQEYLGQGMSEEIINNLVKIDGLKVTARTSSFTVARRELDIREIGKILGVAHVLEGSVRKEDGRIRITAQLINAGDGFHEFSETFTREIRDIFLIQEELSVRIVQMLKEKCDIGPDKDRLSTYKTENLDAYELYLKGQYELNQGTHQSVEKAIQIFRELIRMAPDYAIAHAALSRCYLVQGVFEMEDKDVAYSRMEAAVNKAMELDPGLAEIQVAKNLSEFWKSGWNLGKYYRIITRAMAANPGSADLRMFYAMYHLISGRTEEALMEIQLAYKLDPFSMPIRLRLVRTLYCLNEFEKALEYCNAMLEENPRFIPAMGSKAWILALSGHYQQALDEFQGLQEWALAEDYKYSGMAYVLTRMGKPEMAYEYLEKVRDRTEKGELKTPDYHFAIIYKAMNREEEMFQHIGAGIKNRDFNFLFLKSDPLFREYHSDPRFIRLVKHMFSGGQDGKFIDLQTDTNERFELNLSHLCYIAAEDNYSRIFLLENETLREKLLRITLKGIEQQIDDPDIVRCHRSYMINLAMPFEIRGDASGFYLVSQNFKGKIPISRSKGKQVTTSLREKQA